MDTPSKIKNRILSIAAILFALILATNAKAGESLKEKFANDTLKIGQTISDNYTFKISHFPQQIVKLSDFKGKLLILDFWNRWCLTCIQAIPEMERLQNQFKGKIQIILVTTDKQASVNELKSDVVRKTHLPMIIGDTVLAKLVAFQTVPTHVWINKDGKVVQITDGFNTTAKNIQSFLDGQNIALLVKHEKYVYNPGVPTWLAENGAFVPHLKYYSFIMNHVELAKGGSGFERDSVTNKIDKVVVINQPIAFLYGLAFNADTTRKYYYTNRLILDVKNPGKYFWPTAFEGRDKWAIENSYTYELKVPVEKSSQMLEIMKTDLDRFFDVHAKIEKRLVKCLVLKRISTEDKIRTTGGESYAKTDELGSYHNIHNRSILSAIINPLNFVNSRTPMPVVDGTGYKNNIDININCKFSDIPSVKKELQKYGLNLVEEFKTIDMLVIKDNPVKID